MIRSVLFISIGLLFLFGCGEIGTSASVKNETNNSSSNRTRDYIADKEYSYEISSAWVKDSNGSSSGAGNYYYEYIQGDTIVINVSFEEGKRINKAEIKKELNFYNSSRSIILDNSCIQTISLPTRKMNIYIVDFKGLLDYEEKLVCMIYLETSRHSFVQRMILPLSFDVALAHEILGKFILSIEKDGIPLISGEDELRVIETDCFDFN